ncbi:MAG: thioredoxin domain-containing protein [Polyangiaceae bacterium]
MRHFTRIGKLAVALVLALSACDRGPETAAPEGRGAAPGAAAPQNVKGEKAVSAVRVPISGAKIKGSDRALVTIVEMSDYACPFCKKAHQTIESLLGEYGDKVRLAVLENPLPFHKTAAPAAKWAFAAGEQGRFWQARDALFAQKGSLDDEALAAMAKDLGLDADRLERDRKSLAAEKYVQSGLDLAASLGVTGTPCFFVNGVRLVGAQPAAAFRAAIDAALTSANALVARGVRPEDVYSEILKTAAPAEKAGGVAKGHDAKAGEPDCGGAGNDDGKCDPAKCDDVSADEPSDAPVDVDLANAPIRGSAAAPVILVVFTDFECPYCRKAEETVRALEKAYPGKLRIAYKSAPLPFHEHARLAAKAALAAKKQGPEKFFEYRDMVFAHQDTLDRATLVGFADKLGLDARRFAADLDDPALEALVAADVSQGEKLSVKGTPTFFVNGKRIIGAQPEEVFRKAIDAALAAKSR